jgi:hypothetical protein
MEILAGLSVAFLVLTAAVVATRTYALWFRTRGLPELLLSLYLTFATVLGYPVVIAMTQIPASQARALHAVGLLLSSLGPLCLLLFTLKVFRPDAAWARVVFCLALLPSVVGSTLYGIEVAGPSPRPTGELVGVNLLNSTANAVAYFWATFEALAYHRQLRLRLRLGLAEAAVVDRMLLWGLMTLAAGVAVAINLVAMIAGHFLSPPIVVVSSVLGLGHACCLFLAFHPPRWYAAWVERRAARTTSA